MRHLMNMGFLDFDKNMNLLSVYHNNVETVLTKIIDEN